MPQELLDPRTMLPVGAVIWGPFPLRRARLLGGLALLPMALLMVFMGLQHQVVTCARSGVLAEQCTWQGGLRDSSVRRFPLAALRSVQVTYTETMNKGRTTHWGQVVLDISGRSVTMHRQKAADADENAAALQTFLRSPAQQAVRIDTGWSVGMLVLGGVFALMGAALVRSVWNGRRRFRFTWDASTQQLAMQPQSPLGTEIGSPATWSLREPVEVEIQWGEVKDFFTSSRSPGPRGGRLVVRLASGSTVELLPAPMPGYGVHLRAATELRRLLRCAPAAAAEAARLAASYESARPQLGPGWTGISGRIAATWLGACCGSVLGMAISGVLAVLLGFVKLSDNADGPWFFGGLIGGVVVGVALAWRLLLRPDER